MALTKAVGAIFGLGSPGGRLCRPRILTFCGRRLQHNEPHKHKEYFQNVDSNHNHIYVPTPHFAPPAPRPTTPQAPFRPDLPTLQRIVRSFYWANLFCAVGVCAGIAYKTYVWLYTDFEPGTDMDDLYIEEIIKDRLASEPLLQVLIADPEWIDLHDIAEEHIRKHGPLPVSKGHFVGNVLRGSRGLCAKIYLNPYRQCVMVLVHFGSGVEGWPSIVHGGILTTIMKDAMELGASVAFPNHLRPPLPSSSEDDSEAESEAQRPDNLKKIDIQFVKPVESGDVYSIFVLPATALGKDYISNMQKTSTVHVPRIESQDFQNTLIGIMEKMDVLPYKSPQPGIRYATAMALFDVPPPPPAPLQLTMDGKLF